MIQQWLGGQLFPMIQGPWLCQAPRSHKKSVHILARQFEMQVLPYGTRRASGGCGSHLPINNLIKPPTINGSSQSLQPLQCSLTLNSGTKCGPTRQRSPKRERAMKSTVVKRSVVLARDKTRASPPLFWRLKSRKDSKAAKPALHVCADAMTSTTEKNPEQGTRSGFTTRCCLNS